MKQFLTNVMSRTPTLALRMPAAVVVVVVAVVVGADVGAYMAKS